MPVLVERKSLAVLLGLVAALSLSSQDMLMKIVSEQLNILQIVFVRSVVTFSLIVVWVRSFGGWQQLKTSKPGLLALRVTCNLIAWFCYYLSLPYLSLPVYTAVGFMVFLFAALLSGPVLKEPLSWREWLAAAAGVTGLLLITDPFQTLPAGGEPVNRYAILLLLFGALMWAISILLARRLGAFMSSGCIMFYSNLGLLFIGCLSAPVVWRAPSTDGWLLLFFIGVLTFLGQNLLITAVQYARVAVVTPTQYTMLLWASLYSWLVWEVLPGGSVALGAAFIIGGSILVLKKQRK